MSPYIIESFDKKRHDNRDFECGIKELDDYIKKQAGQESRKHFAVVYICRKKNSSVVIGYYTLSSNSLELNNLPESSIRKLPRYKSLPVILIGRFAIHKDYQKQGIGTMMLMDAFNRSYRASKKVASYAIIVEVKNEDVRGFYEQYGFKRCISNPLKLYLPIDGVNDFIGNS